EKAFKKAEIHTNLLLSSDTKHLKLCKEQDQIYEQFRKDFPNLDVKAVTVEDLKGDHTVKWREFCMVFQEVKDYNFGSLLRLRADESYTNENTVLVPQVIFFAVEIARNLEGIN
ncbi:UNVERIFIED_CONTAM: Protein PBDC1, partial [Eudyptes robustus]